MEELGYRVHITSAGGQPKILTVSELNGLNALVTPAWIFSQKSKDVSWANAEAVATYFSNSSSGSSTGNSMDKQTSLSMDIYSKVEDDLCTVHIVGPKWLLLSEIVEDISPEQDDPVHLVVTPVSVDNKVSMLFQQVTLDDVTFGERLELNPTDTPMDIVIRMLDMMSVGIRVPPVQAKLIKKVILEGADVNQPLMLLREFNRKASKDIKFVTDLLGIRYPPEVGKNRLPMLGSPNNRSRASSIDNFLAKDEISCFNDMLSLETFDAFAMKEKYNGNLLTMLSYRIIDACGLINILNLNRKKLITFLDKIEKGYSPNRPYHNSLHASSVLHSMYKLLVGFGMVESLASNILPGKDRALIILASIIAAVIHDFEHQGLSNNCLIEIMSELAITHNDLSPQEQHHCSSAFHLMTNDECNFMDSLPKESMKLFRSFVISMVLHTDMQKHFALMTRIKHTTVIEEDLLILQLMLKCADMSHLTYPFDLHVRWVKCLQDEMFQQGDFEASNGLLISPLCDRNKPGIMISQVEFFDFIAIDMFKQLSIKFPKTSSLYEGVMLNYERWKAIRPRPIWN